tara:strand:- start:11 stop:406 length:396 start_codon:yes stop_codon:yes gene_type:complete
MFLVIPGQPVAKGRPRFTKRGFAYTPAKTVEHEQYVIDCFNEAHPNFEPIEGPLRLTITFSMQIPKSWSKRKQADAELGVIRPTGRPDLDNLAKVIDALNGLCFKDDSQVVEIYAVKKYGTPQTSILIEGI